MTDTSQQAQLHCSVRSSPNGTTRLIFTLQPAPQYVGELEVDAADVKLLPAFAQLFANWANQQQPKTQDIPGEQPIEAKKLNGTGGSRGAVLDA